MTLKKERNYGIDILRILSMLAIIGLHVLNYGGGMSDEGGISLTSAAVRFIITVFYCSVNVFAMITGYLYAERKNVKCSNLVSLLATMVFYCAVVTAIFLVFRPEVFANKTEILYSLFPPIAGKYWYLVCYILVFLMVPVVNKLISVMTQNQYKALLGMLFLLLSVVSTFGLYDYFRIKSGYSPFWLIFCYLVGGYIKLYVKEETVKRKKIVYLSVFLLNTLAAVAFWAVAVAVLGEPKGFETVVGYVSPLTVCNAVLALLVFSNIKVKGKILKNVIGSLSGGAFDVYIIHCQTVVFSVFFENNFTFISEHGPLFAIGATVSVLICVYTVCYCISLLRRMIFKLVLLDKLCLYLGKKLDKALPLNQIEE